MPLDDLTLDLKPPPSRAPELEVMTRVLRLPTASLRQARGVVTLQLDRLSPLPATDVVYDLVPLRRDGADTIYALGLVRRSALSVSMFADQKIVQATRPIDGVEVTFRYRNAAAVSDLESRWLSQAPRIALACLGVAAVALAGNIRSEQWRDQRLPEIAAQQRQAARDAQQARLRTEAWTEWNALGRTDAATRLLCVASRLTSSQPVAIGSVSSDPQKVILTPRTASDQAKLLVVGGASSGGATGQPPPVTFGEEICA